MKNVLKVFEFIALVAVLSFIVACSGSNPIATDDATASTYNVNGHSYELFNQTMSWTDAKSYCEDRKGYLATITTPGEQAFIENLLTRDGDKNLYWLGGYNTGDFKYQWVTGEPFEYTNWSPAALRYGYEDKLLIYRVPNPNYEGQFGMWEDDTNDGQEGFYRNTGFICEWN